MSEMKPCLRGNDECPIDCCTEKPDPRGAILASGLIERDISTEAWREYDFGGRVYRIHNPLKLFYRDGGTTHRVTTDEGITHCVPAPGPNGCVLRWKGKDGTADVRF